MCRARHVRRDDDVRQREKALRHARLVGEDVERGAGDAARFQRVEQRLLVHQRTGVFVIPYLQSLGLDKDDLVQALGLSFTVSTIALAVGIGWNGGIASDGWLASVLAVIPALIGMQVGQVIRTRISPLVFRRVFLVFLLLLGLEMASRSLF